MLQLEDITKSYGINLLFADISLTINAGDKVGLIARNGLGKTTLLNIIAGVESPDSGKIVMSNDWRIGYLAQDPKFARAKTVLEACLEGDDDQARAVLQYERALSSGDAAAVLAASQAMDAASAWDHEERFKQVLTRLKIDDFAQPIEQLSGGQMKRVALARILIDAPQMIILDEPTNHLDIDIIEWLEAYLTRSNAALLMVTHDRYFLDNVCNRILEIDRRQVFAYDGNYNYYLEKRAERVEAQNAAVERARNLLRTELEWMRRQPQARQHKAQYRIDAFYDLRERARAEREKGNVKLEVKSTYIGKKIFIAHHVAKRYGDKVILDDFNYTFARYEKLGIVGDNGVGKSTFIKLLLGEVEPDVGEFEIGQTVRFGYYSQEGMSLNEKAQVIDAARDIAEYVVFDEKTVYTADQFLNLFLFDAKDQQKYIGTLSGGEKRRLYLALTLMSRPNFLILDEPTNDLDISTLEVLEDYLAGFKGCVIIVSHDRFFMDRTVDHTLVFEGDGVVKDFPGNYSEYRAWKDYHDRERQERERKAAAKKASQKGYRPPRDNSARMSYKERQELEALTAELASLTEEKEALDSLFASGEVIADMTAKSERYEALCALLDEKELRWLELSEKEQ